jgi:hypothetical protein
MNRDVRIIDLPASPTPTYSHDLYDSVSLVVIWLPATLLFAVVFLTACLFMAPLIVPMWLYERLEARQ